MRTACFALLLVLAFQLQLRLHLQNSPLDGKTFTITANNL
jgi:hypothetical protein